MTGFAVGQDPASSAACQRESKFASYVGGNVPDRHRDLRIAPELFVNLDNGHNVNLFTIIKINQLHCNLKFLLCLT